MALNAPVLGVAISTALASALPGVIVPGPNLDAFCLAIAQAVVVHLKTAGQVVVVTACPAGAGTGTGTAGTAII